MFSGNAYDVVFVYWLQSRYIMRNAQKIYNSYVIRLNSCPYSAMHEIRIKLNEFPSGGKTIGGF